MHKRNKVSNEAVDTPSCSCYIDEETGLKAKLFIALGCRVMLTHNTWVEGGQLMVY